MTEGKKVIFVSVPMSGKDDALIERSVQLVKQEYLKRTGFDAKEVIFYDNHRGCKDMDFSSMKIPALGYLAHAIEQLGQMDEAIFGTGWQFARGCIIEMIICKLYGIPVRELNRKK